MIDAPHRIFLGYAPGVGKTYAMLAEARQRAGRGEDVVIGFLGPHTRPRTMQLADGVERVPAMIVPYRGSEFAELDAEAVVSRSPQWVAVDELAHHNLPGGSYERRWESVEHILAAGIGVLSTLNMQHIESLNDFVFQVSGVHVDETVPDAIIRSAQVVVVDADPDDLLTRIREGTVLAPEEVGQGLTHFFRKPTLVALRAKVGEFSQ